MACAPFGIGQMVLIEFVDVAFERKVCLVGDRVRSGVLVVVAAFAVRTPAVEVLLPQAQTLCTPPENCEII